jgi:hypothetical protein
MISPVEETIYNKKRYELVFFYYCFRVVVQFHLQYQIEHRIGKNLRASLAQLRIKRHFKGGRHRPGAPEHSDS